MAEIVPAILPKNFTELQEQLGLVRNLVKTVQIDICDGKFALNETWPYWHGVVSDQSFLKIVGEDEGLPFWQDLDFEFDLMVKNPEEVVPQWIAAGASRVIVHIESVSDFEMIEKATAELVELGIALNPSTQNEILKPLASRFDFIQCMGNDKIGFHGVELDSRVYQKIKELRREYPQIPISVDIGVSEETAPLLVVAGATRLVSGSAIFESGDIAETIKMFENIE